MNSQHAHELLITPFLHSKYRSSNSGNSSVHLTTAEKQALLLTLQRVSKSMRTLISNNCKCLVSITIDKFDSNTPEAWLARHGHMLAELHVGKGVVQHQQLAAIARGLQAANARPGGLQLQVFTGHASWGMAAVLAELRGSSQHLTRLELQPARCYKEEEQDACITAVEELLQQLHNLKSLTLQLGVDETAELGVYLTRRAISVAHLSHLTSLNFEQAFLRSLKDLPSSLQQLRLDPVTASSVAYVTQPLHCQCKLTGLRSLQLNIGWACCSNRQQLLEQLAAQCTKLTEVCLEYRASTCKPTQLHNITPISKGEMTAWALLPVRSLNLALVGFDDVRNVQLFPQLLAATHKHLTKLHCHCLIAEAVRRLPLGLVQLTGLRKLHLTVGMISSSSKRQQLLEQVAAQCTSLREVGLDYSCVIHFGDAVSLERGEMAAWALLPVCSLDLSRCIIPNNADVQLFPKLLADTHQHLTELNFSCTEENVAERLPLSLAQLTGLHTLSLCLHWKVAPSGVEQLCEVVGSLLVNLRELTLSEMHVSQAVVQHLAAARSLTNIALNSCTWSDGVGDELESRFEQVRLHSAV